MIEWGLFLLSPRRDPEREPADVIRASADLAVAAEAMGFDAVWVAEHHFSSLSLSPSPLLMLAHIAGRTRSIALGTGVLVLPLHHPMRLAEEIAATDALSGGRLRIGVGSGSQDHESRGLGTGIADAHGRFLEALDIIEAAFRNGRVAHEGRYFRVPPTEMSVLPVQRPHPPIWLAGLAEDRTLARRAAERGYVPFASGQALPIPALLPKRAGYEAGWRDAGLDPAVMPFALQRVVYVTEDPADAAAALDELVYTQRVVASAKSGRPAFDGPFIRPVPLANEPPCEILARQAMIGTPEHVARLVARDVEALRPTHFSCFMQMGGIGPERVLASMRLFAERVRPRVSELLAERAA